MKRINPSTVPLSTLFLDGDDDKRPSKRARVNSQEGRTLKKGGSLDSSSSFLPRTIVDDILAGLSVAAIRHKYHDAGTVLEYWLNEPVVWQALGRRDIEMPLQEGIKELGTLLAERTVEELGGSAMQANLQHLRDSLLPDMILAVNDRMNRGTFDETAYEGFFRMGAADMIELTASALCSATALGIQDYYRDQSQIRIGSAINAGLISSYHWKLVTASTVPGGEAIDVGPESDRELAVLRLRTTWTDAVARHLFFAPRSELRVSLPASPFKLLYNRLCFGKGAVGFTASAKTGFMPVPVYAPVPMGPPPPKLGKKKREELRAYLFSAPSPLPPKEPMMMEEDSTSFDEEELLEVFDCTSEDYVQHVEDRLADVLSDLPN